MELWFQSPNNSGGFHYGNFLLAKLWISPTKTIELFWVETDRKTWFCSSKDVDVPRTLPETTAENYDFYTWPATNNSLLIPCTNTFLCYMPTLLFKFSLLIVS
jgi:hypothetical protein